MDAVRGQLGGLDSDGGRTEHVVAPLQQRTLAIAPLEEPSEEAVRAALAKACPELAGSTISMRAASDHIGRPEDLSATQAPWLKDSARVGDSHHVKFAWSIEAARKLWQEAQVTQILGGIEPSLPVAQVEAVTPDPVLLITRRMAGGPIWYHEISAMSSEDRRHLAAQLAAFLQRLHAPSAIFAVEKALGPLPAPVPQATTSALRDRLPEFISERHAREVAVWCDWADEVQAEPTERTMLHGDFAGHNLLWDHQEQELVGVVDFEDAACGDPSYDLRYLPAQADTLDLLHEVAAAYAAAGGVGFDQRRVMAWHIRTSLGDALWRSEARIALPYGGTVDEWVDELDDHLAAAGVLTWRLVSEGSIAASYRQGTLLVRDVARSGACTLRTSPSTAPTMTTSSGGVGATCFSAQKATRWPTSTSLKSTCFTSVAVSAASSCARSPLGSLHAAPSKLFLILVPPSARRARAGHQGRARGFSTSRKGSLDARSGVKALFTYDSDGTGPVVSRGSGATRNRRPQRDRAGHARGPPRGSRRTAPAGCRRRGDDPW